MGLAVLVLAGAGLLGFVLGGSLSPLSTLPLRDRWLVAVTVLTQLAGGVLAWSIDSRTAYSVGLALSAAAALGFCLRNLAVRGVPLVTLGLLLNALVVGVNGAMPVPAAIEVTGMPARALGDVVPVPLPLRPEVASPGDVLVAAGLGELLCLGMRRRRVRRPGTPLKRTLRAQLSR
jgi:hypothetical protein